MDTNRQQPSRVESSREMPVRTVRDATDSTHRLAADEGLCLPEGTLLVNGVLMWAGDYCRAAVTTVHDAIRTPSGGAFSVTASERDDVLA
jgi:hypothetical protein